jgi:hypothetical protein
MTGQAQALRQAQRDVGDQVFAEDGMNIAPPHPWAQASVASKWTIHRMLTSAPGHTRTP